MIGRRGFLATAAAAALVPRGVRAQRSDEDLLAVARDLARRPWRGPPDPLPPPFAGLDYDSFRGIRPIVGRAAGLNAGPAWDYDLLPPGFYYNDPVTIEIADETGVEETQFFSRLFSFDPRYFDQNLPDGEGGGFSGLRLRHPINAPGRMDEVLVLQGASYFRAIGRGMVYGLSARGIALGTGGPAPEEFPRFTRLRLHKDTATSRAISLEAIIDGPSLAAHMRLRLEPGLETFTHVEMTVFPRVDIVDVGVAPLTSMYFKGPLRASVADDFRPAVHDSDVLWIRNGAGEVLWRPIGNPATLQTSAFADDGPREFGLLQTSRRFEDFEDAEAAYHRRPSARVAPVGNWGPGAVMLVEIPTEDEFMDNIVAFWRPEEPLRTGGAHSFAYDIRWTLSAPPGDLIGIRGSRSGRVADRPGSLRYVVDFDDLAGERLTPDLFVSPGPARIAGLAAFPLTGHGRFRVSFLFTPGSAEAAELRLVLRDGAGRARSPVWLHRWTPARDGGV